MSNSWALCKLKVVWGLIKVHWMVFVLCDWPVWFNYFSRYNLTSEVLPTLVLVVLQWQVLEIGPLQLSHFHKIMGYNLKNDRNGKSMSTIKKWPKFEAPGIKGWDFMTVWIFKKSKKISMEKVVGKQDCWKARPCSPAALSMSSCSKVSKIQTVL